MHNMAKANLNIVHFAFFATGIAIPAVSLRGVHCLLLPAMALPVSCARHAFTSVTEGIAEEDCLFGAGV